MSMRVFKPSHLEPVVQPTLEDDVKQALRSAEATRSYAPPKHPDRISASAQIMCEGIDKLFAGASEDNQKIVDEAEAALNDMKNFKAQVDDGMRRSADGLKKHLCHVMALLEDGTSKMKQNPFNGDVPKFLEHQQQDNHANN